MNLDKELADIWAKEIQKEIDREIIDNITKYSLESKGWHIVVIKSYTTIPVEWTLKYIKGKYYVFGCSWYFEDARDATYFSLTWNIE